MNLQKLNRMKWTLVIGLFSHVALAGWEIRLEGEPGDYFVFTPGSALLNQPIPEGELITVNLNGSVLPGKKTKAQILAEFPSLHPRALNFVYYKNDESSSEALEVVSATPEKVVIDLTEQGPKISSINEITQESLDSYEMERFYFHDEAFLASFDRSKHRATAYIQVGSLRSKIEKCVRLIQEHPESLQLALTRFSSSVRFIDKAMVLLGYLGIDSRQEAAELLGKNPGYLGQVNSSNSLLLFDLIQLFSKILEDLGLQSLPPEIIQELGQLITQTHAHN